MHEESINVMQMLSNAHLPLLGFVTGFAKLLTNSLRSQLLISHLRLLEIPALYYSNVLRLVQNFLLSECWNKMALVFFFFIFSVFYTWQHLSLFKILITSLTWHIPKLGVVPSHNNFSKCLTKIELDPCSCILLCHCILIHVIY